MMERAEGNSVMPKDLIVRTSRDPVTPEEQLRFAPDLTELGLDAAVWSILNASLSTRSEYSSPKILRAYQEDEAVGIAMYVECRQTARCITRNPFLVRILDASGTPSFAWLRISAALDQYANPGFVAGPLDRRTLIRAALEYLTKKYLYGFVFDRPDIPMGLPSSDVLFPDFGYIEANRVGAETYLQASKNLRKKVRKFGNKRGRVDVVRGPMPTHERKTMLRWMRALDPDIRLAFQDNYPAMVDAAVQQPETVHVLAYLDDAFVGNQSFVQTGRRLVCLSGIFDPDRKSNYHAYENVILESIRLANAQSLDQIDYGPIVNPTKARMMTRFEPSALRYYSRFAPIRRAMQWALNRSRIGPEALGDYIGLEPAYV